MSKKTSFAIALGGIFALALFGCGRPASQVARSDAVFNIRDLGATGVKEDLAQEAIQAAVDACAAAGGGTVLVPPGDYTTGTIHLRSHVRLHVEAGATVFSIHDKSRFDKDALLYGEDLIGVTIEGRGVFDGEAAYDRRLKGESKTRKPLFLFIRNTRPRKRFLYLKLIQIMNTQT